MSYESLKEKGNDAFKMNEYAKAISLYSDAIALKDNEPTLYSNRAACFLKTHNYARAYVDANRCIELDRYFIKAYVRGALACINQGQFEEAKSIYQAAADVISELKSESKLDKYPSAKLFSAEIATSLNNMTKLIAILPTVRSQLKSGSCPEALESVGAYVGLYPDCFALAALKYEALAASEPERVLSELGAYEAVHGGSPQYLQVRALAAFFAPGPGAPDAAALLREAVALDPDREEAKALLRRVRRVARGREAANAAFRAGRWDEAARGYAAVMAEAGDNAALCALMAGNRAACRMELGQYSDALRDCNAALAGPRPAAKLYARRARIHAAMDNPGDALRDIQEAAARDPAFRAEAAEMSARAKKPQKKDYYKILGCERGATEKEIKKAYKIGALKYHPDKWGSASEAEKKNAEAKFKEMGEAFGVLSDPQKKQLYDAGKLDNDTAGAEGGPGGFTSAGGMPPGFDPLELFNMMMGGGGSGGKFQTFTTSSKKGNTQSFSFTFG